MYTVVGWSESQDPNGAFVPQTAIPDQHVRVEGDSVFIQEFNLLLGGFACDGTVAGFHRFVSPSLRRVNPHYLQPIEQAIAPAGIPQHAVSFRNGIPLDPNEQLQSENNATLAGAQQQTTLAFLADSRITQVEGKIFTLRFQFTLALILNTWTFSELDFIDELPVGPYDLVGASIVGISIVGFRFVPIGAHHRPGAPGVSVIELADNKDFRFGNMGVWCPFETIRPPGIEVCCSAAVGSATYEGVMDVIPR